MLVLNFSRPLTSSQKQQIERDVGAELREVDTAVSLDQGRPVIEQVRDVLDQLESALPEGWEQSPLLINAPSHAVAATTLLTELHGRLGYFPAMLHLQPVVKPAAPQFKVAEIINLRALQTRLLQELVELVPEEEVRHYLKESIQCFETSAYNAALVAGWCAVARYLQLIMERIGYDVFREYVPNEIGDLTQLDGRPLMTLFDKTGLLPRKLGDELGRFWKKRCDCAHPTGVFVHEDEVDELYRLIVNTRWLICRTVDQERLPYPLVLQRLEDLRLPLTADEARRLVHWVPTRDLESLATTLLEKFFSDPSDFSIDVSIDERIVTTWEALGELLNEPSKGRLMDKLADRIEASRRQLDVMHVGRLVFWSEAKDYTAIWEYFDDMLHDDSMTCGIVAKLRIHAPSPYRERAETWPSLSER